MLAITGAPGAMEKERARVEAMRERNGQRLKRFLNARTRTIGIDTDALAAQREENRLRALYQAEADQQEHATQMAIAAAVDARDREEREFRRREMEALRREWKMQAQGARAGKQAERNELMRPINADACGPSAVQQLRGEDRARAERIRAQHEQVCHWTAQSVATAAYRRQCEQEVQRRQEEELRMASEAAAAADAEEMARRRALNVAVKSQNSQLAAEKAARLQAWQQAQQRANEAEMRERDAALAENKAEAYAGRRILHDRYKGLTDEQRRSMLAKNEELAAERALRRQAEAQEEEARQKEHEALLRAVDAADREQRRRAKLLEAERQAELKRQRDEGEYRKVTGDRERFGAISAEGGFYGGFGQSCR